MAIHVASPSSAPSAEPRNHGHVDVAELPEQLVDIEHDEIHELAIRHVHLVDEHDEVQTLT